MRNFTFHVGEDFFHPLSGLRAIYEAVTFIGLNKKDRIGHGTAMGIDAEYWTNIIGKTIPIKKGDLLDNLVFLQHLKKKNIIQIDVDFQTKIENKIRELSGEIYTGNFSINTHIQGWLLRKYCPILMFSKTISEARRTRVFDGDDFNEIQSKKIASGALRLHKQYHSPEVRRKYNEPTFFDTTLLLNPELVESVQIALLKILCSKKIVIETLPTSNVRISCAKDFSAYHFLKWEAWRKENYKIPQIVVGTDDTGIFATNLRNEYACIGESLIVDADVTLSKLIKNGKRYQFV